MQKTLIFADDASEIPDGHMVATVTRTGYVVHDNICANPMYILIDFSPTNDGDIIERTVYMLLAAGDICERIGINNVDMGHKFELVDIAPYNGVTFAALAIDYIARHIRHLDITSTKIGLIHPPTGQYAPGCYNTWSDDATYYVRRSCNYLHGRCVAGCYIIDAGCMLSGDCLMMPYSLVVAMDWASHYFDAIREALIGCGVFQVR